MKAVFGPRFFNMFAPQSEVWWLMAFALYHLPLVLLDLQAEVATEEVGLGARDRFGRQRWVDDEHADRRETPKVLTDG